VLFYGDMMEYWEIPSWREFQHYKDRNPPWIKLHYELLTSHDWVMLADASRVLLVACMLIASRNEGKIPNDPDYIRRVAYMKTVDFKPLIDIGFLVPASGCKQMLADARPEAYKEEAYKEEAEKRRKPSKDDEYDNEFLKFWKVWPNKDAKMKAYQAWKKNKRPTIEKIIQAVEAQKTWKKWTKDNGSYVPLPATWINGHGWDNEEPDKPEERIPF